MQHSKTANNASNYTLTETDGKSVANQSETTAENEDDDFASSAKRMKPTKQVYVNDSNGDDASEIVVLD